MKKRHYRTPVEMRREGKRIAAKRARAIKKRKLAHKGKRTKKRHYGDAVPNLASIPMFPMSTDSLTDSLGMLMLPMIARGLGFRGRDIFTLIAKILPDAPPPTTDQREPGTASSTGKARARSNKKGDRK
jgi:hypothetical protein